MRILRKCEVCGEEFIATKITNKYCSKRCARVVHRKKEAEKKKKARESKKDDAQNLQSLEIASRPFLTPSDVAFLLGVSVTTVYRCFYSGTLKAVRLRRKTYVRREDLDKYFEEAGAYKKKSYKRKDDQEYYTLREIMEKYNIGRKAVWGRCDRLGIPKVYVGRNTFFSKKAVDAKFADLLEEIDLDNYYTMDQVMEMYGMTRTNAMSFVTYHKVPRVNRNGKAYYSKIHIDSIKQKGNEVDPDWYTYEEISEKYGLTKDQISYTLKNYDVRTEKRGKFTMIYRTDFDKITQQRMGKTKKVENLNGTERVIFQAKAQERACPPTPEGYYSTEEVAEMFKITIKHVGVMTRENKTPKIALKNFNFYEKKAIDILYNQKHKYADINDWITPEEMRDTYKMTHDAVRSFIHRHKIPSKVEYGVTYYSKQHIQALKTGYFEGRERYYSVEEAMKKYGMTKDIVHYYVKHYKVTKVKKGQFMFFRKEEFDRLMEKRFKNDDLKTAYTE